MCYVTCLDSPFKALIAEIVKIPDVSLRLVSVHTTFIFSNASVEKLQLLKLGEGSDILKASSQLAGVLGQPERSK